MQYEVSIVGDIPFEGSQFNGEDHVNDWDTDGEATLKESFVGALNLLGIKIKDLEPEEVEQMVEDTFFDVEVNGGCFNININEM